MGMRIEDALNFQMGNPNNAIQETNTFQELYYGILIYGGRNTRIYDAVFRDLRFEEGVRLIGRSNAVGISVFEDAFLFSRQNHFENVFEGIYVNASQCIIIGDTMTQVNSGVQIRNLQAIEKSEVSFCQIKAAKSCIRYVNVPNPAYTRIENNDLELDFFGNAYVEQGDEEPDGYAIWLQLLNANQSEYASVFNNKIKLFTEDGFFDPFLRGIRLESCERIDMLNNQIEVTPVGGGNSQLSYGLETFDSDDILFKDNVVEVAAFTNNIGVNAAATTNATYCCNRFLTDEEVFQFSGVCEGTALNQNEIGQVGDTLENGLVCLAGTPLGVQVFENENGQQEHRGNRWLASGYEEYGAVHFDPDLNVVDRSRFVINNSPMDSLRPINAMIKDIEPPSLFATLNIAEIDPCNENIECNVNQDTIGLENLRISELVNRPDFTLSPYSEMLNWETKQYLIKEVNTNPDLLTINDVNNFYNSYQNSTIDQLHSIKEGLTILPETIINDLEEARIFFEEEIEILTLFQNSYQLAETVEEKALLIEEQKSSIQNLQTTYSNYQDELEDLKKALLRLLQDIQFQNNLINTENRLTSNEQVVNIVHLLYLLDEDLELNVQQRQLLFDITNQCPRIGGRSVYKARVLYQILVSNYQWEDEISCSLIENRQNEPQHDFTKLNTDKDYRISVFPNPSLDHFNVRLNEIAQDAQITLRLYDWTGRLVKTKRITELLTSISTDAFSQGVYFLNIEINQINISTKKIVVIK